jgi:hypothetical protein
LNALEAVTIASVSLRLLGRASERTADAMKSFGLAAFDASSNDDATAD